MLRLLLVLVLVGATGCVSAQDAAAGKETRCLVAGKAFSPGATIRAGAAVLECKPDGSWGTTDKDASGCFAQDEFFSVGAIAGVTGNKDTAMVCLKDGSWATTPPK